LTYSPDSESEFSSELNIEFTFKDDLKAIVPSLPPPVEPNLLFSYSPNSETEFISVSSLASPWRVNLRAIIL